MMHEASKSTLSFAMPTKNTPCNGMLASGNISGRKTVCGLGVSHIHGSQKVVGGALM